MFGALWEGQSVSIYGIMATGLGTLDNGDKEVRIWRRKPCEGMRGKAYVNCACDIILIVIFVAKSSIALASVRFLHIHSGFSKRSSVKAP